MTIFTGNLSPDVKEADLRELFCTYGEVEFVNIIKQRNQKTSAGYGFVAMKVNEEAERAIAALHQSILKGQPLIVNDASPRTLVPVAVNPPEPAADQNA
jgi:RNA recognition motif-containing protein